MASPPRWRTTRTHCHHHLQPATDDLRRPRPAATYFLDCQASSQPLTILPLPRPAAAIANRRGENPIQTKPDIFTHNRPNFPSPPSPLAPERIEAIQKHSHPSQHRPKPFKPLFGISDHHNDPSLPPPCRCRPTSPEATPWLQTSPNSVHTFARSLRTQLDQPKRPPLPPPP